MSRRTAARPVPLRWLLCLLALACAASAAASEAGSVEVGGAHFAASARVGGEPLRLNGAGVRSILGVRLYIIGIYLAAPAASSAEALAAPGAKRIQVVNLFDLGADAMAAGMGRALRKNLSDAEFAALRRPIELFVAATHAAAHASAGSLIQLDWLPAGCADGGACTRLLVNGERRGEDIAGEAFYQALLKVWLGDKVNDAKLRSALLGRGPEAN